MEKDHKFRRRSRNLTTGLHKEEEEVEEVKEEE